MLIEDPTVLLVDDSEDDAMLMRVVFQRAGFGSPLQVVHDGESVIAYLRGEGAFADRTKYPLPTALLLDLNMPRKNGFEILAWIRGEADFKRLCVYILSASSRGDDIRRAYDLGANSYLVKPGTLDELTVVAKCLRAWLLLGHFCAPDQPDPGAVG